MASGIRGQTADSSIPDTRFDRGFCASRAGLEAHLSFSRIAEPDLSSRNLYPLNAQINGSALPADRKCIFSSGAFREPILAWESRKHVAFGVSEEPLLMKELSPTATFTWATCGPRFSSATGRFLPDGIARRSHSPRWLHPLSKSHVARRQVKELSELDARLSARNGSLP